MKHPVLPRGRELGLPLVSGVLLTLSFPPFHLLVPPFVALVPFLAFVASRPGDRAGRGSVLRASFWMGVLYYGTLLYWLFTALVFYTWLALLGYLITVVVLSALLAAAGWAVHRLRTGHGLPFWATLPVFLVAVEWLRGHLGDLSFPWLGLGHSLTGFPALVGFADIVGARGVTFWLAAINGLLAEWWVAEASAGWRRRAAALALLLLLPIGYSLARWATLETRPAARVLVVQPNIPEDLKLDRDAARDTSIEALFNLTEPRVSEDPELDLIVWPETALPGFYQAARGWTLTAAGVAFRHDVPLLFGALDLQRYRDGGYGYYNAAVFFKKGERRPSIYRKHYLVPMVERVPFIPLSSIRSLRRWTAGHELPLLGDLEAFLQYFGGYGRGEEEPVFRVDSAGFGVLICYESIFPALSRTYRRQGADLLVNITNDAWFGRERPWWSRTSALHQHPAHLVMRAIENRVGIARSANTGISMFVDPRGRRREATPLFETATRVATVETTDEMTLYTRFGDWVGWLSISGAVLLAAAAAWRDRRRADGSGD